MGKKAGVPSPTLYWSLLQGDTAHADHRHALWSYLTHFCRAIDAYESESFAHIVNDHMIYDLREKWGRSKKKVIPIESPWFAKREVQNWLPNQSSCEGKNVSWLYSEILAFTINMKQGRRWSLMLASRWRCVQLTGIKAPFPHSKCSDNLIKGTKWYQLRNTVICVIHNSHTL